VSENQLLSPTDKKLLGCFIAIIATPLVILAVLEIIFPSYDHAGDVRRHARWQFQEIALAFYKYVDAHEGHLPPAVVTDKAGRPLYSWRVAILPFFSGDDPEPAVIYREFHLDEPWDSDHNQQLIRRMPSVYRSPLVKASEDPGLTYCQGFVGPGTAFERPGLTWGAFSRRTWTMFLAVEAADPVPWSKPVDLTYDPNGPLPRLGGRFTIPATVFHRHIVSRQGGFSACFCDGAARFIRATTDEPTLRGWISQDAPLVADVPGN
jgi:hypothetical protein